MAGEACQVGEVLNFGLALDVRTGRNHSRLARRALAYNLPRMADIDNLREMVRLFWAGDPVPCPRHPGATLSGEFVATTYADHLVFECPAGGESTSIPQRPRQREFNAWQTEGLVVFLERGDNILCYRCQSRLAVEREGLTPAHHTRFTFTCVRCLSFGTWQGDPRGASIEAPSRVKSA